MMSRNKQKNRLNKKWFLAVMVVFALGFGAWRLWIYTPKSKIIVKVGNTSKVIAPNASSTNNTAAKSPTNNSATSTGTASTDQRSVSGAIDTNGQSEATTPSSDWTTSVSGLITVQQPIANATLASGAVLSGTAKVDTVHYALIDDSVGLISQGTLTVDNGRFSGKIVFSTHSSSGRLDVYSTNSQGVESNEVQIGVYY